MTTKTTLLIAVMLFTATAGAVSAQSEGDSLRCEARKMRAESQYFGCLSRCDRRADRNTARPVERRADTTSQDCEATCTAHFDDDVARIGGKTPCTTTGPTVADPRDCEARMLRISASTLRCQARCGRQHTRKDYDPSECLATCQNRCGTAADALMADPICAAGRIGEGEACAIH